MVVAERRGWLDRVHWPRRSAPTAEAPRVQPLLERRPAGYAAVSDAERVINGFVACIRDVPGIERVSARTIGQSVQFRVTFDGVWHQAIDLIEPRITGLVAGSALPFDYSVIETSWGEADPPGYLDVADVSAPR